MNYANGIVVCLEDMVRYGLTVGIVEKILGKGTEEAEGYGCAKDAVLIRTLSKNDRFLLYAPDEEDLVLIMRSGKAIPCR